MGAFEPLIPPGKRGGGKRRVNLREVVNGVMYILSTGCQWRCLPKDLPPRSTVHDYFSLWTWDRTLDRIHHELYLKCREKAEREASPTACIIDSQSVKSAEKGGLHDPPGFDAGSYQGQEGHVLVDTQGLLLHGIVTAADVSRRRPELLASIRSVPLLEKTVRRQCLQGPIFHRALADILPHLETETSSDPIGSPALSCCPSAGSSNAIAWLNRCRRLAKDGKTSTATHSAFSSSLQSASCYENSVILHKVSGRTLSAGDRSTLALAFFLAKLELDSDLTNKIVVFDDPFTSQDLSRRTWTQQRICRIAKTAKQVIVLSHEPTFLSLIYDAMPSASVKTLQFCRIGQEDTTITPWDITDATRGDYFKNHGVLTEFANEGEGDVDLRHIARTIRLVLEAYFRFKFPSEFEAKEWLGDFIDKIRAAPTDSSLSPPQTLLEDLEDINDYSKKYHHETNPSADREQINDGELRSFVRRTLEVVGGY